MTASSLVSKRNSLAMETSHLSVVRTTRAKSIVSLTASMHEHHMSRGKWNRKSDFFFSIVGTAVGLGSLWRFPYLVYKHNGGGFILIYIVSMFLLGIPAFYLELLIGQYLGASQLSCMAQIAPGLKGIGYSVATILFMICIYYCVILSWTMHYTIGSLIAIPSLPWVSCGNYWNTLSCYDPIHPNESLATLHLNNITLEESVTSVEEYWFNRVLQLSDSFVNFNGEQPELVGLLLLAWIVIYFIVWKGLHSSGKVIWFSALFPYVILVALFIKSVMLEGATDGLKFYLTPNWKTLLDPQAWIDGGTQITMSYSIGLGALFALGSYNDFKHNVYRDALIVGVLNPATALFAGCVTFSVLGYLAKMMNKPIADVVQEGPGLSFIAYPQVVATMKGAPAWSLMFFCMMMLLGINSLFSIVEATILTVVDSFPKFFVEKRNRFFLNIVVCLVFFLLGLPQVSRGGLYIFSVVDEFAVSGIPVIWAIFFQFVTITWVWGSSRLTRAVNQMMGKGVPLMWIICWKFIIPLFLFGLFIFKIAKYTSLVQRDPQHYPGWVEGLGWCMSLASMLWIPGYFIYFLITQKGTFKENLKKAFHPQVMLPPNSVPENMNGVANLFFITQPKTSIPSSPTESEKTRTSGSRM